MDSRYPIRFSHWKGFSSVPGFGVTLICILFGPSLVASQVQDLTILATAFPIISQTLAGFTKPSA